MLRQDSPMILCSLFHLPLTLAEPRRSVGSATVLGTSPQPAQDLPQRLAVCLEIPLENGHLY